MSPHMMTTSNPPINSCANDALLFNPMKISNGRLLKWKGFGTNSAKNGNSILWIGRNTPQIGMVSISCSGPDNITPEPKKTRVCKYLVACAKWTAVQN